MRSHGKVLLVVMALALLVVACVPTAALASNLAVPAAVVCTKGVVVGFLSAPGGHVALIVWSGHALSNSYFTTRHFSLTQRVTKCAGVIK
jgi:hypothetical protein